MAAPIAAHVPRYKLIFEGSNFSNSKSKHVELIEEHYFNHSVDICIPGATAACPGNIEKELVQQKFYCFHNVPLSLLITKEFIGGFVKKGCLYMLSSGTHIDTENCVALTPNGDLILHIDKDTYEQLGLDGKPSIYNDKKIKRKFVVTIGLTQPCFQPGKNNYERVKWCLTERLDLNFDFLVTWVPEDDAICPSSISAYFERFGIKTTRCKLKRELWTSPALQVPVVQSTQFQGTETSCAYTEFFEWLGAVACNVDCSQGSPDSYVSTYSCPEPNHKMEGCVTCRYRGFLAPANVINILHTLRSRVKSEGLPWASMTVHGYADSPVSWGTREHGYSTSGDNLYTFVIFDNGDYWLYKGISTHDVIF